MLLSPPRPPIMPGTYISVELFMFAFIPVFEGVANNEANYWELHIFQ